MIMKSGERDNSMPVVVLLVVLGLIAVACMGFQGLGRSGDWNRPRERPLQTGTQRPTLVPRAALSGELSPVTVSARCPHEDGDPSGQPCLWVHPRTGVVYVVDSSEYRD